MIEVDGAIFDRDLVALLFEYPRESLDRKHGPLGYKDHESYRGWLRDEFLFRCAYCRMCESWLRGSLGFEIDHGEPLQLAPHRSLEYDNLFYTCPWCNRSKANAVVPDPFEYPFGLALRVDESGVIHALNDVGRMIVEGLQLDHPEITYQRSLIMRILRLAQEKRQASFILSLLGFPDPLPNLGSKRPPNGNSRPDGVSRSCYELQRSRSLPAIY